MFLKLIKFIKYLNKSKIYSYQCQTLEYQKQLFTYL